MAKMMSEDKLRQQAVRVLAEKLGPVDALRFLASVSREPFNYQRWRKRYFSQHDVGELLEEVQRHHGHKGP